MKLGSIFRNPKSVTPQIEQALRPVLEGLEGRLMLSTHRHRTTLAPAELISGGQILTGVVDTNRPQEIRELYGLSQLDVQNQAFPFYTNKGTGQLIVIIGAVTSPLNTRPQGQPGNLAQFDSLYGVGGPSNVILDPLNIEGFDPTTATDQLGDIMTTGMVEWAHAMAPFARLELVECPTNNGVMSPTVLQTAIQEAVRDTLENGAPGPIDGSLPGGVIVMGLTSKGEDATLSQQYDALFSYKYARSSSFIAPAGDFGGTTSMPANSPWVTSVGSTRWQQDAAGNRQFEIADQNSGGNQSSVESLPPFQRGLSSDGKRLRTRGTIDLAMASMTPPNQGIDIFWDPTLNFSDNQQFEVHGTEMAAAMFAGMVADLNELRFYEGLGPIGRDLNNEMYAAWRSNPAVFFDITQGNNTLHQAGAGYDLASGLGAPQANLLIPALAGVSNVDSPITFNGDFFSALKANQTSSAVVPLHTNPLFNNFAVIGSQFIDFESIPNSGTVNNTPTPTPTSVGLLSLFGESVTNSSAGTTDSVFDITIQLNPAGGLITRNLDNTFSASCIANVVNITTITTANSSGGGGGGGGGGGTSSTVTTTTEVLPVVITGRVSTSRGHTRIVSGQLFTVNSRGKRIPFGASDVIQGTFSSQ